MTRTALNHLTTPVLKLYLEFTNGKTRLAGAGGLEDSLTRSGNHKAPRTKAELLYDVTRSCRGSEVMPEGDIVVPGAPGRSETLIATSRCLCKRCCPSSSGVDAGTQAVLHRLAVLFGYKICIIQEQWAFSLKIRSTLDFFIGRTGT